MTSEPEAPNAPSGSLRTNAVASELPSASAAKLSEGRPLRLLTVWAEHERKRLLGVLKAKEVEEGIQTGRLHPKTMPIHRNILMLDFAFDRKRKHSTGRVRALFVLYDHGRTSGKAWISISTLMKEAGFAERNNARRVVEDLHKANIIPKTQRPPTGEVRCYSTNLYEVPKEAGLLDLVFASATGITALYAYVLRKLWVDEGGVGSAYLTRKGVRDALAEGVLDKDGKLVLNRTLSDTKIVEHLGTLLSSKTVLKVDNGRVTIPAARGYQPVKVGATRVWDRKDRGTKKPRRVAQTKSFANLPPPPFVDAVSPPPPVGSANLSPPPNGVYPNFAPPKPRQTPFRIKNTEGPSPADAIHLSPQTASGTPSALADISTIEVAQRR